MVSKVPAPPQQGASWVAPSGAPAGLVAACQDLFRQGLADPRGCEYVEIAVRVRRVWGGDEVVDTRGWAFADRFAVAWNGLVYALDPGPRRAADLEADVAAMLDRDMRIRREHGADFYRHRHAWNERLAVSFDAVLPIRPALLVRLGEASAASRLWSAWHAGMSARTNDDAVHLADPYLMLAIDWIWALFDRAVTAHMHGDDGLALASAEQLVAVRDDVEATAARRGFTAPGESLLPFLAPLDALVADQRRRRDAPARSNDSIASLEDVCARQWSQPGGVNVTNDPRVASVIAAGHGAVASLLDALVHDERLTRSVSFWRDFSRHRHLVPVYEVAYAALEDILGTATVADRTALDTPEGRRACAAAFRTFHEMHRAHSPEQRWFAVLADDRATRAQWLEAAESIVPERWLARGWDRPPAPPSFEVPGAALRTRRDPSVTELMIRRLRELAADPRASGSPGYRVDVTDAGKLASALGRWDPRGGADVLRAEVARCERLFDRLVDDDYNPEQLGMYIAVHTAALARSGDDAALARFTAWLRRVGPARLSSLIVYSAATLVEHRSHPTVDAFLRWAFHAADSSYLPILRGDSRVGVPRVEALISTQLLYTQPFRERVIADLADARVVAQARVRPQGTVEIRPFGGYGARADAAHADGQPVRYCDVMAWHLVSFGAPRDRPDFEPHWPLPARNSALADLRKYLDNRMAH